MLTNKELTRVEPRAFVRRMLRDFDRFFEEGWTPFAAPARVFGEFAWTPTLEVVEKNRHLVARFELPGMKKEGITVTVAEDHFTVEGERILEEEEKRTPGTRPSGHTGSLCGPYRCRSESILPTSKRPSKTAFSRSWCPFRRRPSPRRKVEIAGEEKKVVKSAA